jgi:hypothetical protein
MMLSKQLVQNNSINISIDKFLFYKIFLLLVVFTRLPTILWQITQHNKLLPLPISIFNLSISPENSLLAAILFALCSGYCLIVKKTNRIQRVILFSSYFVTHMVSASFGFLLQLEYSMFVLFVFLTLIPQADFENPDNTAFNQQLRYAVFLILLIYTISGVHKMRYFLPCVFSTNCFNEISFLDFQVFGSAIKWKYKILFESFFVSMQVWQSNLLYLMLSLFELATAFAIFNRKWLKTQLILLCIFHLLTAVFLRAYFVPTIMVNLLILSFCMKTDEVVKVVKKISS